MKKTSHMLHSWLTLASLWKTFWLCLYYWLAALPLWEFAKLVFFIGWTTRALGRLPIPMVDDPELILKDNVIYQRMWDYMLDPLYPLLYWFPLLIAFFVAYHLRHSHDIKAGVVGVWLMRLSWMTMLIWITCGWYYIPWIMD